MKSCFFASHNCVVGLELGPPYDTSILPPSNQRTWREGVVASAGYWKLCRLWFELGISIVAGKHSFLYATCLLLLGLASLAFQTTKEMLHASNTSEPILFKIWGYAFPSRSTLPTKRYALWGRSWRTTWPRSKHSTASWHKLERRSNWRTRPWSAQSPWGKFVVWFSLLIIRSQMLHDQSTKDEAFRQLQAEKDVAETKLQELNTTIEKVGRLFDLTLTNYSTWLGNSKAR